MKVQLDETDIINKAIENMLDDKRFDELALIAGQLISTISAVEQDPHGYFDAFVGDCRKAITEYEGFVDSIFGEE